MDAVLKEFAEHGFTNASTNRMVQAAEIGKGMLFYYFKNKEELFRYAFKYSLDYLYEAYVAELDYTEPDFITRYTNTLRDKMQAYLKNPMAFTFIAEIYLKRDGLYIAPDLYEQLELMTKKGQEQLLSHVDTSLFRSDVPPEHVFNLVRWSLEGYQKDVISALDGQPLLGIDWEPYLDEFHEFLSVLRRVLYRQGG